MCRRSTRNLFWAPTRVGEVQGIFFGLRHMSEKYKESIFVFRQLSEGNAKNTGHSVFPVFLNLSVTKHQPKTILL